MAARIPAGIELVGPFPGSKRPTNGSGLYIRVSRKTGEKVWAHWDANRKQWGLYSDTQQRALQRAHKRSKKQLDWYGTTEAASKGRTFRRRPAHA